MSRRSSGSALQSAISSARPAPSSRRLQFVEREFDGRGEDALAPLHEALVLRDAEDPRLQAVGIVQLVDAFEDLQEGLLRDFLRVLAVAAHQEAVLRQPGAEGVDELRERGFIARQEVARDFGVGPGGGGHIPIVARLSDGVIRFASRLDAAGAGHSSLDAEARQHPAHDGDSTRRKSGSARVRT